MRDQTLRATSVLKIIYYFSLINKGWNLNERMNKEYKRIKNNGSTLIDIPPMDNFLLYKASNHFYIFNPGVIVQ